MKKKGRCFLHTKKRGDFLPSLGGGYWNLKEEAGEEKKYYGKISVYGLI
jgi:hypothetical protein